MISAEQLKLWTVEELKQHLREEQSRVNTFNDRVRLAKDLLAAGDDPDLQYLVVDEEPVPEAYEDEEFVPKAYEEPAADALSIVGPGSKVSVCRWTQEDHGEGWSYVSCRRVLVTHRSGDEFCGFMGGGYLHGEKKITFELKHICYVEDDGVGET